MGIGLFCFAGLFCSCHQEMFEVLNRTPRDPFEEIPVVRFLEERYTIQVTWSFDEAADEYLLYRAQDDLNPDYHLIYQGYSREYSDCFTINHAKEKYLYRLLKRRGGRIFGDLTTRGKAALGYVSENPKDVFEPNETKVSATLLTFGFFDVNSHYFESNTLDHLTIYDQDWYSVDIPAKCLANILLIDIVAPRSHPANEHFEIVFEESVFDTFVAGTQFPIRNELNIAKRCYFMVKPKVSIFRIDGYSYDTVTGGCGQFVPYKIRINTIEPI
jgi:hypothetical protein